MLEARGLVAERHPSAEIRVFYKGGGGRPLQGQTMLVWRPCAGRIEGRPGVLPGRRTATPQRAEGDGRLKVGLLIDFGRHKVGFKRFIF